MAHHWGGGPGTAAALSTSRLRTTLLCPFTSQTLFPKLFTDSYCSKFDSKTWASIRGLVNILLHSLLEALCWEG